MSSSTDGRPGDQGGPAGTYGDGPPRTYLVELRAAAASVGDVQHMHRALRYAVARQAAGGTAIRWTGAVVIPAEGRCLCLVESPAASAVVCALDSAGLRATPMRAYPVRDSQPAAVAAGPRHHDGSAVPTRTPDSDDDTSGGEH